MGKTNNHADVARLSFPQRFIYLSLRIFFKLLYHQFAWMYEFVAWTVSLGSWQKWVQAASPYIEGARVLEIGVGPGHLQLALQQKNNKIFGLDESRQMVKMANKRLRNHGFRPNLLRGDALTLPFVDESFNQVVMTFPSEYILKSATISEIRRTLVRGGMALILPVAWITGRKPWEWLVAWINRITGEAPDWNPGVLEPLKEAGFDVSWEMIDFSNSKIVLIRLRKDRPSEIARSGEILL